MVNDGVSVVTTTWNEWNNVEKLVVEIRKALRGHSHEIIVVDDSSTDGTIEVAKRFADVAVQNRGRVKAKACFMECIWQNTP